MVFHMSWQDSEMSTVITKRRQILGKSLFFFSVASKNKIGIVPLETRKLCRVDFRKDFLDCYWGDGKQTGQQLNSASPGTIPEVFAKSLLGPVPLSFLNWPIWFLAAANRVTMWRQNNLKWMHWEIWKREFPTAFLSNFWHIQIFFSSTSKSIVI